MQSPFSFANVILPLSVEGVFTYSIPISLQGKLQIGQRVVVPFGGKKLYTAIVYELHHIKPELYKTKDVLDILEDNALVTQTQLKLWDWIAKYYMCSLGEVYRNAFPTALKLESETFIKKKKDWEIQWDILDEYEILIMQSLEAKTNISLKELEAFLPSNKIISTVKQMYEEGFVELDELLIEKYTPKKATYIRLNTVLKKNEIQFSNEIEKLKKAEKQLQMLMAFISIENNEKKPISKKKLLEVSKLSASILKTLCDKNILEMYELQEDRISKYEDEIEQTKNLSPIQQEALESIQKQFQEKEVVLLQGITSSGKTEVYFHLIEKQILLHKTSLYLLPEIAITTQLITRIQKKFGDVVGIYHSKMSTQERVEIYKKCLENKFKILIGARSALFLPFQHLGLIIIDEEHDSSFKQNDIKPLYNAKESAIVLGKFSNAKVILGSATPSLESYYNAKIKKYGWTKMSERFGNVQLPKTGMINLKDAYHQHKMKANFSEELITEIQLQLNEKKQVILFQNRRGYSPSLECNTCGYSINCPNCDVNLTFHKSGRELKCHYCGYKIAAPTHCVACHSTDFNYIGIGTQQIEEELQVLFPTANIFRMDADTMRQKHAYEKLFEKFEAKEIDILLGTQMVTKGLDFKDVQLVGVIRGDSLLNQPDFRCLERAFQLLTQVSGRAGRRELGKVIIQTFNPQHFVFQSVLQNDFDVFAEKVLEERKNFLYPPFVRLIEISFKHKDISKTEKFAQFMAEGIKKMLPEPYTLGAEPALIPRINNQYIYKILVKIPPDFHIQKLKNWIKKLVKHSEEISTFKQVKISIDVDPM